MRMTILIRSICILLTVSSCGKQLVGPAGPMGSPGTNGQDASPCVVTSVGVSPAAPNGGSLITCPTTSSLVLNGTNGVNGAAGTPGTVITMIKLCPGTTVYPSKFIEVAACIGNKLYGVYSANDGFMTELPPGTYGSNGINASCNLTIGVNCAVMN